MKKMKHVGWVVREVHGIIVWSSNEKKLGYVNKCVKVYVEAPDAEA